MEERNLKECHASRFSKIPMGMAIEVTQIGQAYAADKAKDKVNLSIGGYLKGPESNTHMFAAVKKAEEMIVSDPKFDHSYLPTLGYPTVNQMALELLLGEGHAALKENRGFSVQSIGGTGPLRIAADLLRKHLGFTTALYSDPTWINHRDIFLQAGFGRVEPYPYKIGKGPDGHCQLQVEPILDMLRGLENPEKTVLILHASAHNPTGVDPTREQWHQIKAVCHELGILPCFDCAYQGFASGDLDADAWPVRHFSSSDENIYCEDVQNGHNSTRNGRRNGGDLNNPLPGLEVFVSQSFGKNMGLYGERTGFLACVVADPDTVAPLMSQLALIVRAMYSNPSGQGAKIVGKVLSDEALLQSWRSELKDTVTMLQNTRARLRQMLEDLAPACDWSGITAQTGMFYLSNLTPSQGRKLMNKHHVYIMLSSGRVNVCAINDDNICKVANAIADVALNP